MKTRIIVIIGIILILASGIGYAIYKHSQNIKLKQLIEQSRANMVYIPGGTYTMGPSNPDWQAGNTYPSHKVSVTGFYISKYNVSYGEYDTYTSITGKPYIQKQYMHKWDFFRNANHPVDGITWYQANDYCQWLKQKTGLPYDLPTEAQWEYVARNLGKKNWPFATNNGKQELCKNFPCNKQYKTQKGSDGDLLPLPVGSIPCTPMGICGLSGEVYQWMKDWYQKDNYKNSPVVNPQGPATGTKKVLRGSGAQDNPVFGSVFNKDEDYPNKQTAGFRCVINTDTPPDN